MYADEVFFWGRRFAGEPLHALARGQGDVRRLDAQSGGCCCGRDEGCQMHGSTNSRQALLLFYGCLRVLGPAASPATMHSHRYGSKSIESQPKASMCLHFS